MLFYIYDFISTDMNKLIRNHFCLTFFLLAMVLQNTGCSNPDTLFKKIDAAYSGIQFNNSIVENDTINPLDLEFLYNGGGVAVGDFNKDGLPDLYFTASTGANKLYLNKGKLQFKDITEAAQVTGEGRWANAASIVDINQDGLDDIYLCTSIKKKAAERTNLLYINQGNDQNGTPIFKESAQSYGLADTSFSVHAAFFDYDNDGDLDMYLLTTKLAQRDATQFINKNFGDTSKLDFDKLYRNDWNDSLQHPVYTDVSTPAGIKHHGYGLGIAIADINKDGWKDIYITNDFYGSDHCYINNKNGSFSEKLKPIFKHTSQNAMGNDFADINNDGLADIIAVDMNPEDNFRKKKNMNGNNYFIYQNMMNGAYMLQYVRNTLQLNQGPVIGSNDSISDPVFSEVGFMAGIAETDWSWNPSIADFNNDTYRDIIITNGYPRDVTDHDFAAFRQNSKPNTSKKELIDHMPIIKIPNYAYMNKGANSNGGEGICFSKTTHEWGLEQPSFSNGAVYADLDNDGDLDYVINNINDPAFLYENTTNNKEKTNKNYLSIAFKGEAHNKNGIGAIAAIYYEGAKMQVYENSPYRGYLSTVDTKAFFGLNTIKQVDSIVILWNNGKKELIPNVKTNQTITVDIEHATLLNPSNPILATQNIFTDITQAVGVNYFNREVDYNDFNEQILLPHKLSEYGPALASGDIDGNGLDDIMVGGSGDFQSSFLLQQKNGKFIAKQIPFDLGSNARRPENAGILLFDADKDGDLDLYMASGSNEFHSNTKNYQDKFYTNDGKGNFSFNESAFPPNYTSKSCVKSADFDRDGDLDLFLGGRVLPNKYPLPVSSFIYRNDSKNGHIQFTDITQIIAPELKNIGLICDAIWTDFNNDGTLDLMIAGEFMPIQFFKNTKGKFENISSQSGINNEIGWWNSLSGGDFDNDGDIDYMAGNLGTNSFYRASKEFPVSIYAKDFDQNNRLDIITTVYLPDRNGELKEYPAQTRDEQAEQIPSLKKRFLTHKEFGKASFEDIFRKEELKDVYKLQANNFASSYIENLGGGKFKLHALPLMAQIAPLYGMVIDDFNLDGNIDVAINGNDYGTEVGNGRYDALNGLVLLGNGKGSFSPQTILASGIYIPGNGKALIKCRSADNNYYMAASQNNGPLKIFKSKIKQSCIALYPTDQYIIYTLLNGQKRKEEYYRGNSYFSQSAPFIIRNKQFKQIEVINNMGIKRLVH